MKIKSHEEVKKMAEQIAELELQSQMLKANIDSFNEVILNLKDKYYKELERHRKNWYEHLKNERENE